MQQQSHILFLNSEIFCNRTAEEQITHIQSKKINSELQIKIYI